jgi:hypothetical protein
MDRKIEIANPLIIVYQQNGEDDLTYRFHAQPGYGHEHYGIMICDLVRHIAASFKVDEERVWEWVDKERFQPTDEIRQVS